MVECERVRGREQEDSKMAVKTKSEKRKQKRPTRPPSNQECWEKRISGAVAPVSLFFPFSFCSGSPRSDGTMGGRLEKQQRVELGNSGGGGARR